MQATQTVTIQLPDGLYRQVQSRASRLGTSVEGEVVALIAAALPTLDDLPGPLVDEMAQLVFLSADELLLSYDRSVLLRAQSMALLKERGHDVSDLLPATRLQ